MLDCLVALAGSENELDLNNSETTEFYFIFRHLYKLHRKLTSTRLAKQGSGIIMIFNYSFRVMLHFENIQEFHDPFTELSDLPGDLF